MPRILTDSEIQALLDEPKKLPANWQSRLKPRYKSSESHGRRTCQLVGDNGSKFCVHVRDNRRMLLDFSIILVFVDGDGQEYTLTRFNGKHPSQHTNKWEKKYRKNNVEFRNTFHIHTATERYQSEGYQIEGYAEPTTMYSSFDSALRAFVSSNGLYVDQRDVNQPLFDDLP